MKLISKLPEPIRSLALQRQRECTVGIYDKETDVLEDAFDWGQAEEGFVYWNEIDDQPDPTFKEKLIEWLDKRVKDHGTCWLSDDLTKFIQDND